MKWTFWVDRGGTFTDMVAVDPSGVIHNEKLLSVSASYADPVIHAIRKFIGAEGEISDFVAEVRLGTTIATNALLQSRGRRFALVTTEGFPDVLVIGDQRRKDLFELDGEKNTDKTLYDCVIEAEERMGADGKVLLPLNKYCLQFQLQQLHERGIEDVAISFVNSYKNPIHEQAAREMALSLGFKSAICGTDISLQIDFVNRTRTAAIDAYLSPVLAEYITGLRSQLQGCKLLFMQSHGGLCDYSLFRGSNSLLSGPAGGVVGAQKMVYQVLHKNQCLAFDMGGTSTDISIVSKYPTVRNSTEINGFEISVPSIDIETIAAGGGSILYVEGAKMRVGPESAGSDPGPACYGRGGPLTVTDANLFLGRIDLENTPKVFGISGDESLDVAIVTSKFSQLSESAGIAATELAKGFLEIATENIASAINAKALSQGQDSKKLSLCAFGGAAGQIVCMVAEKLKVKEILLPHSASVLSAVGIGLSDIVEFQVRDFFCKWEQVEADMLESAYRELETSSMTYSRFLNVTLFSSDVQIRVEYTNLNEAKSEFQRLFRERFGFENEAGLAIHSIVSRGVLTGESAFSSDVSETARYSETSPGLLANGLTTVVVDKGWKYEIDKWGHCILRRDRRGAKDLLVSSDAISLEIFNRKFRAIAEQMGIALQQSAQSINIRERLDFSCALFLADGDLIANAPHIPVHLGSMQDCVKSVLALPISSGDVFLVNSPYSGGTHLPDLTVITPVFHGDKLAFIVACRAHHADIGGSTPGSMPSDSKSIHEEGALFDPLLICRDGKLFVDAIRGPLENAEFPSRNVEINIADIRAQLAANERGKRELLDLIAQFGFDIVDQQAHAIMDFSEWQVRRALNGLNGRARLALDKLGFIDLVISEQQGNWIFDFTKSSDQVSSNFNAPKAVVKAVVMYCLRCLIDVDLPLNSGCLRPVQILTRPGSLLDPQHPAAVVAGNVETSQVLVDAVFKALGKLAGSQGTMNNVSFGNQNFQYYETVGGGSGAGDGFDGISAKQIHMTNSKLTDVEVLESRIPVRVDYFFQRWGSGGCGEYVGGDGLIRKLTFATEVEYSVLSNRRDQVALGLSGAESGVIGRNLNLDSSPLSERGIRLPGESIIMETPGGGGFGATDKEQHLYFAFGSNLSPVQVLERTEGAQIQGVARLREHRLAFTRRSKTWDGFAADIIADSSQDVWGVLYRFSDLQIEKMDVFEGHPHIYQRIDIAVELLDGSLVQAFTYKVVSPDDLNGRPSYKYIHQIWQMVRRFHFPLSYKQQIRLYLNEAEKLVLNVPVKNR